MQRRGVINDQAHTPKLMTVLPNTVTQSVRQPVSQSVGPTVSTVEKKEERKQ